MICEKCGKPMVRVEAATITAGGWTCLTVADGRACGHMVIGEITRPLESEDEAHGNVNGPIFADNPWQD